LKLSFTISTRQRSTPLEKIEVRNDRNRVIRAALCAEYDGDRLKLRSTTPTSCTKTGREMEYSYLRPYHLKSHCQSANLRQTRAMNKKLRSPSVLRIRNGTVKRGRKHIPMKKY
jgi:hypothetical protein